MEIRKRIRASNTFIAPKTLGIITPNYFKSYMIELSAKRMKANEPWKA